MIYYSDRHTHGKNDQVHALYNTVDTAVGAANDLEHNKRPIKQKQLTVILDFKNFLKNRINKKITNHLIPYKFIISAVRNMLSSIMFCF